MYFWKFEYNKV